MTRFISGTAQKTPYFLIQIKMKICCIGFVVEFNLLCCNELLCGWLRVYGLFEENRKKMKKIVDRKMPLW